MTDPTPADPAARARAAVIYNPIKIDLDTVKAAVAVAQKAAGWDDTLWLSTSEDDPAAVVVEAENATLRGAAAVTTLAASTGTNASGSKFVGFVGNGAANTIEIPRSAGITAAGEYDIAVSYSNAELSGAHDYNPQVVDRRIDVSEKDIAGSAGHAYFRYTYSWNSFWERTIPVTLTSASAPIVLGNASAYAPNIDRITIAPVSLGTPTTVSTVPALDVTATASTRCVAGKVVLTVVVTNNASVPVDVAVTSAHGSKSFTSVAPAKKASAAFSTRLTSVGAGTASVLATATVGGQSVSTSIDAAYPARSC
ncbi:hypothetical protein HQQ81_12245 [Microbacteriaceae bacterium VKM Ac-2854]|nr:hypothetical protein [Microbacteriaceae bacterium VKM Ac-2854]